MTERELVSERARARRVPRWSALAILCAVVLMVGCTGSRLPEPSSPPVRPIRFLLTFDDGPSLRQPYNPTSVVLDTLAKNSVQPQIKAVFFVQTRSPSAGGSALGRRLLQRTVDEGHVLALHSGSARGHKNHRYLPPADLDRSRFRVVHAPGSSESASADAN